jgi:hypothetical protein
MKKKKITSGAISDEASPHSEVSSNWYDLAYKRFSISMRKPTEDDDFAKARLKKLFSAAKSDISDERSRQ